MKWIIIHIKFGLSDNKNINIIVRIYLFIFFFALNT